MRKRLVLLFLVIQIFVCKKGYSVTDQVSFPDSIEKQILYNGRAWKNLYTHVQGNQFLFTGDYMPGTVTIDNKRFDVGKMKYDIYNDELLVVNDHGIILQLNKENTSGFSLNYYNKDYQFKRIEPDSINDLAGYVNVLYEGDVSLYVKYRKNILLLAVDNKYDLFDQVRKIYLKKGSQIFIVNGRGSLLNLLKDRKQQIRIFIKTNRVNMSKQNPESFVPVVDYYNKLLH